MEITDVRIFLQPRGDNKLKAYVTITFENSFVVRNVKVIEGTKGLFVAMPSERVKEPCPKCGFRNVVRSKFCNQCGAGLTHPGQHEERTGETPEERQAEHRDIAHPITMECREYIQKKVLDAYEAARSQSPEQ
ncbi:MAG: septation protein SpoVG family protein [Candidatus Omnitrophica bacterium]|nr:septation protein SpoVG family protein [Candidatus Omnitrophota bacterium]